MDFDEGAGVSKAVPKPSKFQPKPRRKPVSAAATRLPKQEPSNDGFCPVSVKKEQDSSQPADLAKVEGCEPSLSSLNRNGTKSEPELIADGGEPMDLDPNSVFVGEEQATQEEEEEDCIVSEYDVYFNPSPLDDGTQLFVFQYPLRPVWRPYELDERCTEVRVKSSTGLEIDLALDVDSTEYDPDAPSAPFWKKLTLSSLWRPYLRTGYAIGVVIGNKLHINPIHAVRQLRPSMENLNPSASKKKNVSEVATKTAESSGKLNKVIEQKDDEPWIPLKYHRLSSDLSARYLQKMFTGGSSSLTFSMKPIDYLDSLCPPAAINKTKLVGPSKRFLLSLPLDQRLRLWLEQGPSVHKFSALKHYAPDEPAEDVLRILQQYALLVQGHWVAKTPIRFPNAKGPFVFARDNVLLLFSQSTTITDSKLKDLRLHGKKVPDEVWKDALNELAIVRPKCGDWKFKEPTDVSFMKNYPDIVEEQERKCKMNEEQMREKTGPKKNPMKPDISGKPHSSMLSERSAGKSATGGRTMSNDAREALPKVLRKLFQTHKVCSFQTICQGLRDMAVSQSALPKADARATVAAACGADAAPQKELEEVICEVAVNIHGVFVLKSSLEHPEHNPLRNVVIDLFIGKGPNAKVKKSEIFEAAKMQLKKEPSRDEMRKVLNEFCVSKGSAWELKSGDGAP